MSKSELKDPDKPRYIVRYESGSISRKPLEVYDTTELKALSLEDACELLNAFDRFFSSVSSIPQELEKANGKKN